MLVLSRKKEEVIVINDSIRIKIVEIHNESVKLGIDAPNDVKIHREEIWLSIQKENLSAAQTTDSEKSLNSNNQAITSLNKQIANRASLLKKKK